MDMSQMNMQDPRIQMLLAQLRSRGGGGMPPPGMVPGAAPMAAGAPMGAPPGAAPPGGPMQGPGAPAGGPAPQAVQAPLMGGPPPQAPQPGMGGQLNPAMIDSVLGLSGQDAQRDALKRQYALADAMRADAQQQTRGRIVPSSTGGMMVGPNWANAAAAIGGNYMAGRNTREADKAGAGLDVERQKAQRGYFDALTNQRKRRDPNADLGGWGSMSDL